uniref:Uncharacterized protein n=1 Tax=Xiphophorus maculatus TaxID=8083 RepID=A0A3B5Q3Z3_XIPMA
MCFCSSTPGSNDSIRSCMPSSAGKIRKYYVDKKKSTLYKVGAPVSHQQQANKTKTTAMIFTLLEGILPFSLFVILIFLMTYLIFKLVCNKIPVNFVHFEENPPFTETLWKKPELWSCFL